MWYDIVSFIGSNYAQFILWLGGGAASAEIWLLLIAVVPAMIFMAVPLFCVARLTAEPGRTGTQTGAMFAFLSVPLFVLGFMLSMIFGINGNVHFQENFRECVQFEDITIETQTPVMVLMCRYRDHVDNDFSPWEPRRALYGTKFHDADVVDEMP